MFFSVGPRLPWQNCVCLGLSDLVLIYFILGLVELFLQCYDAAALADCGYDTWQRSELDMVLLFHVHLFLVHL